ncbi:MAG TPA: RNA methyltransferase [Gemmatimonadaceae bacterium]|nr:RNA methyltransferase [Gemmatimonadaceae bacterium]
MKLLSLARDLQRRKARERQSLFVAEGVRAVEELLASSLEVVGALVTAESSSAERLAKVRAAFEDRRVALTEVSERDFLSASDTDTPQGVLAVAKIPDRSLTSVTLTERGRMLVLDAIQDPGNVGTILRTAAAFDVTATVAMPGTVDLWNAKVVRSAMGALFRHHALSASWNQLDEFLAASGVTFWGADAAGARLGDRGAPSKLAIAVGNEGNGLTSDARSRVAHTVSIPTASTVESLNVAVAAGILLHHFRP